MVKNLQETRVLSLGRKIPWRRKWQPTPVFLPGESHGQRSLVGNSPQGRKQLDMTEQAHTALCASPLDFTGASNSLGWKQNSALPNLCLYILPSLGPWNYPRHLSHFLHPGKSSRSVLSSKEFTDPVSFSCLISLKNVLLSIFCYFSFQVSMYSL